jgi:hypothetical protein
MDSRSFTLFSVWAESYMRKPPVKRGPKSVKKKKKSADDSDPVYNPCPITQLRDLKVSVLGKDDLLTTVQKMANGEIVEPEKNLGLYIENLLATKAVKMAILTWLWKELANLPASDVTTNRKPQWRDVQRTYKLGPRTIDEWIRTFQSGKSAHKPREKIRKGNIEYLIAQGRDVQPYVFQEWSPPEAFYVWCRQTIYAGMADHRVVLDRQHLVTLTVDYDDIVETDDVDEGATVQATTHRTIQVTLLNCTAQEAANVMAKHEIPPWSGGIMTYDFPQAILNDGGLYFDDRIGPEELRAQVDGMMKTVKLDHETNALAFVSRQQQTEAAKALTAHVRCPYFFKNLILESVFFLQGGGCVVYGFAAGGVSMFLPPGFQVR